MNVDLKIKIMKNSLKLFLVLSLIIASFSACNKDEETDPDLNATVYKDVNGVVTVTDKGKGTGTMTWTSDKIWVLNGLVFVNESQTLTIDPGTIIKGKPGQEVDASALIVARGGKVMANGTQSLPIIFTAEADQGNLSMNDRGLWGGVIILGKGKLNSNPGETAIEGIPTSEPRGLYGGNDDSDNSGVFTYVSIRHGGTDIGEGNEINGLTLGGVGSATIIDYVEVLANKDDGVEFFGGAPRLKHILVAYVGDDSYDYDEGFSGYGQFWIAVQDEAGGAGDRLGEHDGGTDPETAQPYAIPNIYNATYIGRGTAAGKRVITFRDNAGGKYYNSIFVNQAKGIDVEILEGAQNSYKQFEDGNLLINNCIFQNVADGTAAGIFKLSYPTDPPPGVDFQAKIDAAIPVWVAHFSNGSNTMENLGITASNPVPASGANSGVTPGDTWFTNVSYQGAFEPAGTNWAAGWTLFYETK